MLNLSLSILCLYVIVKNIYVGRFFFVVVVVCLFRATPMAYGGSQARGLIGAVAAGLHHSYSKVGSKQCL